MAQAIKYQETAVAAEKSASEIAVLVSKYGASRFEQAWNERRELVAIRFALRTELGEMPVRLGAKTDRIEQVLRRVKGSWTSDQCRQQAYRIAWRHLKDLSEQLLLAVTLGLKDVGAAFMDSVEVLDPETGATVTMADLLARHARLVGDGRGVRLLPSASEPAA